MTPTEAITARIEEHIEYVRIYGEQGDDVLEMISEAERDEACAIRDEIIIPREEQVAVLAIAAREFGESAQLGRHSKRYYAAERLLALALEPFEETKP